MRHTTYYNTFRPYGPYGQEITYGEIGRIEDPDLGPGFWQVTIAMVDHTRNLDYELKLLALEKGDQISVTDIIHAYDRGHGEPIVNPAHRAELCDFYDDIVERQRAAGRRP